jgi:hypothetical protein
MMNMKKIKQYILLCLTGLLLFPACNDDFIQRDPITELAEGSFLTNEGDLPYYLNMLYDKYITGHQKGWAYDAPAPLGIYGSPIMYYDLLSDNMIKSGSADSRLNESFRTPSAGGGWAWDNLKLVN